MSASILDVDEADLAVLGQVLELAALALAGRCRALGGVECVPVAAEIGHVGPARMRVDGKVEERVALRADGAGHFLQVDQIEPEARIGAQQRDDVAPRQHEALGAHAVGELLRQQRRIVVAQLRPEPGEAPHRSVRLDRKLQDEEQEPIAVAAEHDGGNGAAARADVPLPGGEPIEGLEHGAVGLPLERLPLVLHLGEIAMDAQPNARAGDRVGRLRARHAQRRAVGQRQLLLVARRRAAGRALRAAGDDGCVRRGVTLARAERDLACGHPGLVLPTLLRGSPPAWLQPFLNKSCPRTRP